MKTADEEELLNRKIRTKDHFKFVQQLIINYGVIFPVKVGPDKF
jgi:hypothetical protein